MTNIYPNKPISPLAKGLEEKEKCMDEFQQMIEEMKKDKEGGKQRKFWSPPSDKEGSFPIRILPPLKDKGEKVFYFHHRVHWINQKSYECLRQNITDKDGNTHVSEDCPVCKFVSNLYNTSSKDSDEWKLASSLRAQDRYIYRVVVRGKENETEPEFYESGKSIFEILFHIIAETDFGNITSMKDGRDFILSKKGTGRRAKYETSTASANTTQVFSSPEQLKALVANMKKLDFNSLIEVTPVDEVKKALKASISGEPADDGGDTSHEEKCEARTETNKGAKNQSPKDDYEVEDQIDDILAEFDN